MKHSTREEYYSNVSELLVDAEPDVTSRDGNRERCIMIAARMFLVVASSSSAGCSCICVASGNREAGKLEGFPPANTLAVSILSFWGKRSDKAAVTVAARARQYTCISSKIRANALVRRAPPLLLPVPSHEWQIENSIRRDKWILLKNRRADGRDTIRPFLVIKGGKMRGALKRMLLISGDKFVRSV